MKRLMILPILILLGCAAPQMKAPETQPAKASAQVGKLKLHFTEVRKLPQSDVQDKKTILARTEAELADLSLVSNSEEVLIVAAFSKGEKLLLRRGSQTQ